VVPADNFKVEGTFAGDALGKRPAETGLGGGWLTAKVETKTKKRAAIPFQGGGNEEKPLHGQHRRSHIWSLKGPGEKKAKNNLSHSILAPNKTGPAGSRKHK